MIRGDNLIAERGQPLQIVLHNGVVVHIVVHGRAYKLFAGAGHDGGGEHIVRNAPGELADDIGRGRSHYHQIRLLGKGYVLHAVLKVPVEGVNEALGAGEGFEGDGVNEIGGVFGHEHLHMAVKLFQHPGKIGDFIGGNAAGYSQNNGFSR